MSSQTWAEKATTTAEAVYKDFLDQVIKVGVINNRCTSEDEYGRELYETEKKRIKQNKLHDPRVVRLMSISGKGGWDNDVDKQKRYSKNYNVTLLDHTLSVTRGSLMLASLDWLSRNPEMEEEFLKRKLYVMAVVAFMHDIDKDLSEPRIIDVSAVTDEQVKERMARYNISAFLAIVNVKLEPDQLLYLIDKVESQQTNRRLPKQMPPQYTDGTLPLYVRLADKLDGIWLSADPEGEPKKQGIEGVLNRLKTDQSCIRSDCLRDLFAQLETTSAVIDLFDPHHPFLMDELQLRLSTFSQRETGAPPLLEIHHDGRLVMLMLANQQQLEKVKELAIQDLCDSLPFKLDLFISPRGEPHLLNEKATHAGLKKFFSKLKPEKLQRLLFVKTADKSAIKKALDDSELLDDSGLSPIFSEKTIGQTMTLYASLEQMGEKAKQQLKKAAHAALLLNLSLKTKPKDGIPDYDDREKAFLACIPEQRPSWINAIAGNSYYGHSRRNLTALWALAIAINNNKVDDAIWGKEGLLKQWLEGTEERKGFNQFIPAEGSTIIKAVESHFHQLLSGKRIEVEDESAEGRCLFTDQPVDFKKRLEDNKGLKKIGVKASAFSGRDGRPEPFDLASGHTNISPVSLAEYKLRVHVHENTAQDKKELNTATLIYSPATIGLFGGLAMDIDQDLKVMSLQELSEFYVKRSNILGIEHYKRRYRITRLEYLPGKTVEQVNQLLRLLKATLRIGRPIHVFRGLPIANRAFFYYDAMPPLLAELLGDGQAKRNELRLEQIPPAIHRLEMAKLLLDNWGYGYNALQLYANPKTRFKGLCFAWCGLHEKSRKIANRLEREYESYFEGEQLKMTADVTEEEGVMVKLGQKAATIQRYPKKGFQASNSEQTMVLDICLEGLKQALKVPKPQTDRVSLVNGIADLLMQMLKRRDLVSAAKLREDQPFDQACLEVATLFVDEFWLGVMNSRFPNQGNLRILKSIYRMSFMRRSKTTDNSEVETSDTRFH
ncbi:MAG: hypothetical protein DRR08_06760 [Candidatus Parabeggiatoa sp. nov. 2]|nr:MAG: hypothetical protein B6247_12715 [Beggiatoa sp. 4572_84]RKZ62158.1 MAG: hypothetical protein DRR08_06760 [Gammaproteobacteria bacterium]HEC84453.1 hypothetical protein [Thioploca sp.]